MDTVTSDPGCMPVLHGLLPKLRTQKLGQPNAKALLVTSFAALIYFTFMHITRGDEFGFSRTLLTCLIYILLVPWNRIGAASLRYLLLGAAIFCGINAGYEYFAMSIQRVGIATNPIPYALFCATLFLISLYYLLSENLSSPKALLGWVSCLP